MEEEESRKSSGKAQEFDTGSGVPVAVDGRSRSTGAGILNLAEGDTGR